jgi:hypothetical protein
MAGADRLKPKPYPPSVWNTMTIEYQVPLKDGRTVTTTALTPFVDTIDPNEWRRIRQGYEEAMKPERAEVAIKRQNTLRLLDYVVQQKSFR